MEDLVHTIESWYVLSSRRNPFSQRHLVAQPTLQAVKAVDTLLKATPETPSFMIGVRENKIMRVPLVEAVAMVSAVDHCW